MLERSAGKLARCVLRGRGGCESSLLPGTDDTLPFGQDLTVNVADSAYSAVSYLGRWGETDNLLIVTRLAGNRTVYRTPPAILILDFRLRGL